MAVIRPIILPAVAGIVLTGCVTGTETTPSQQSLTTATQSAPVQQAQAAPTPASPPVIPVSASPAPPPKMGVSAQPQSDSGAVNSTGTFVGDKLVQLRKEVARLKATLRKHRAEMERIRSITAENSRRYHMAVATINARLQIGTTPGNPVLVNEWNSAQSELARIDSDIARLNALANDVASTLTMSSYLLETTRAAYSLSGAVDEDHRQLAQLEDEVNRTTVVIDRLLNDMSQDINRQIAYVGNERNNLTTLSFAIKNGTLLGANLQNRAFLAANRPVFQQSSLTRTPALQNLRDDDSAERTAQSARATEPSLRRPLVVIRFDKPKVAFEQALYAAVSQALERRPSATFDLVAISPKYGSPAKAALASTTSKRNAESVLRSLSEMGMPLDRVRLSAMSSDKTDTNEVHIYVR